MGGRSDWVCSTSSGGMKRARLTDWLAEGVFGSLLLNMVEVAFGLGAIDAGWDLVGSSGWRGMPRDFWWRDCLDPM